MNKTHTIFLFLLCVFFLCPAAARADWVNLSGAENSRNIAEISVEKDRAVIKLEIFVQDLMVFADLVPDDFFAEPISGRPALEERVAAFAAQTFQVITDTGEKLPAELLLAEPRMRIERFSPLAGKMNPFTGKVIPGPPADKRVLYAELSYTFEGQPQSLKFIPPLDADGYPRTSIGFLCYHGGVLVVDFRQLSSETVLNLDWKDPWYSAFTKKQFQRPLSGVRNYLYIEPYEVRHEILVRVKDLMAWMPIELRGDEYIEIDEFDPLRKQAAQFFMDREQVLIDGKQLKPILDRTAYVESSMQRSRFIEIPERVLLNTAMIGVVITYLTDGIPQEVVTEWGLFSDRVQKVTAQMIDPAGPFPYDLEPGDNVLKWTNFLNNYTIPTVDTVVVHDTRSRFVLPVLSVVCVLVLIPMLLVGFRQMKRAQSVKGTVILTAVLLVCMVVLYPYWQVNLAVGPQVRHMENEQAAKVFQSLLENVYRAFDFREEEDVYDKLAVSVSGDLLTEIYLQSRQSMVIEQAGGARAKVQDIGVETVTASASEKHEGAFDFLSVWTAAGTVGHWGHVHMRQNRYRATVTVKPIDGAWKIIDLEMLDETRIDPFA